MTHAGSTSLHFLAPPPSPEGSREDVEIPGRVPARPERSHRRTGTTGTTGATGLRMLKGARDAAAGMHVSDDQIRAVLAEPQHVEPDPNDPKRTRLRRGRLVVLTGGDGTIMRVSRRG